MNRRTVRFAATVLVTLVAACDSATAPAEEIEVVVESGIQRPAFHPPFVVMRTGAQITVAGTFETLCTPTALVGEAHRDGDFVVITISEDPVECFPATGVNLYNAIVTGFISVPDRVRVVHRWIGTNRPHQVVFEGSFN